MKLFDAFVAYKFIKLLSTPFEKTDAFKRGIIDADGNILRKRNTLIDSDDKKAYPSNVYTIVWNLQKILNKIPIVKTRLGKFATALYLLKEETGVEYSVLAEALSEYAGINSKDLLLLEEQGKASVMSNNKIKLTSHLNLTKGQLLEGRYGDAELSWDELPEDEKYDIADLVFGGKEAEKISQQSRKEIPNRVFKQLQKALSDATEGLVTLVERYGESEIKWDDMPEDERYDLADIAFDGNERYATKISKMKWNQIKGAQKLQLIKTMQTETDGLVTLKEAVKPEDKEDMEFMMYDYWDFLVNYRIDKHVSRSDRDGISMLRDQQDDYMDRIKYYYNGRQSAADRIDSDSEFVMDMIDGIQRRQLPKAPRSFWVATGPGSLRDAEKMKLIDEAYHSRGKESARDHWRRINSKGVVPAIDRDRYPNREREGLEGPYRTKKSGLIYYYDKKAGKHYNPDTDMYLDVSDIMEGVDILETMVITEAKMKGKFDQKMIDTLKKAYAKGPKFPSVVSPEYKKAKELLSKLSDEALKQIADAGINYLSPTARLMLSDTNPGGNFSESLDEAIGVSGMALKSIPGAYRFTDNKAARKFHDGIKTNYSIDVVWPTQQGRVVHVEYQTDDKRMEKEARRRISKMAKDIDSGAQIVMEGSLKWSLEELSGSNYIVERELTPAELEKRDAYMKDLEKNKDDFKKRYGDRWMEVLAATATKMAKGKTEEVKEATSFTSIMQVQPRSKDWRTGTLYSPVHVDSVKGKVHKFVKGDKVMIHPFDADRFVGAVDHSDPMTYFFLAKHKVIDGLAESTQVNEAAPTRAAVDKEFKKVTSSGKMDVLAATKHVEKMFGIKNVKVQKDANGVNYVVSFNESTELNEWWEDQVNPRSGGWKNGRVVKNFRTYNSKGETVMLKKGDDIFYHPMDIEGSRGRNYKVVIAATERRDPDTYFSVNPELLGLKGFDNATGPVMDDIGTTTAGVAGLTPDTVGVPVSKKKKKEAEEKTKSMTEERFPRHAGLVKEFKGVRVFQLPPNVFKEVTKRSKGDRWKKTLPEDLDSLNSIRQYSQRNPNKPVIVQCSESGEMKYLRRRLNDQRLRHNRKDKG
jgi:hypothetical protein